MTSLKTRLSGSSAYILARDLWYRFLSLRFLRWYWAGLAFDVFCQSYRTEGMSFEIPRHLTTRIHRARFFLDTHEKQERAIVKRYINGNCTVLELGACLGVVSCLINRLIVDPKNHVAVEANPALIPILEANRNRNACAFRVVHGLVSKTSDGEFYLDDCIVVSGPVRQTARHIRVPVTTLHALEQRFELTFDTLFMDIQGGEVEFIEQNLGELRRFHLVILELHPHLLGEQRTARCRSLLAEAGLRLIESDGLVEVWQRPPSP